MLDAGDIIQFTDDCIVTEVQKFLITKLSKASGGDIAVVVSYCRFCISYYECAIFFRNGLYTFYLAEDSVIVRKL